MSVAAASVGFGLRAERLKALLESFGRVEAVGESFQVYKLGDLDVSLPRRDSKSGRGHRGFDVTGDHVLILGDVVAAQPTDGLPLTYHGRAFGTQAALTSST